MHITSWALTLILFAITIIVQKSGKEKAAKIVHMVLRLFFVFTALTGIGLVVAYQMPQAYIKGALALILIGLMEAVVLRTKKGEKTGWLWVFLVIDLIAVFYFGYVVIG